MVVQLVVWMVARSDSFTLIIFLLKSKLVAALVVVLVGSKYFASMIILKPKILVVVEVEVQELNGFFCFCYLF